MATYRDVNTEGTMGQTQGEAAGGAGQTMEGMRQKAEGITEKVKGWAMDAVESGKSRAAERIERVSERLDQRAQSMEMQGGVKGQVGRAMHKAGDVLENGANYLRTHDIGAIGDDVKSQIREHPYTSVGIAAGTGFMLGRVFSREDEEKKELERECHRLRRRLEHERHLGMERQPSLKGQFGQALLSGLGSMVERRLRAR